MPKPSEVTSQQNNYIENEFNNLLFSANNVNTSLLDGYTTTIDVPSFIDFMVSNELAANADGYQLSTYFHKDRNGKLRAGPIWDFNLTYGNDLFFWGFDRSKTNTWQFSNGDNEGSKFWTDFYNNPTFKCYLSKRFNNLIQTGQPLNQVVINNYIDNTIILLGEAMVREQAKWNTIPNNTLEISNMKNWLSDRISWMTNNLGDFSTCSNPVLPQLVISQINYNPQAITSPTAISSNDQEFIQITNFGSTTVNLSGIYLSQLGTTYQFQYNSTINANSTIYIVANSSVFQTQNAIVPFGQYTRNLSNKSQNIVLADAFGNIIDEVNYFDSTPWPLNADGLGSYLQLTNNSLDNNLASSWVASSTALKNNSFDSNYSNISIYPNPTDGFVSVNTSSNISKFEIIDISGKILKSESVNNNNFSTDISNFSNGIYLLKIYNDFGIKTEKLIKN